MDDEIDSDIDDDDDDDDDEAAAFLICKVKILLGSLAACNIIESSNYAIIKEVLYATHTLQLAVDDALKQTASK